uniref:Ig-like domain-containing protein n=1 Tax=Gasterosteus aculeatus aculeatus TaxID=481459 RepID=A0AAQ4RPF2_GASAC
EINPFLPQPSTLKWASPLTDSASSPIYLQADWFSTALQGLNGQLAVSTITRAPTATKEHRVVLSVTTTTVSVQSRLGGPVLLDCGLWADPSSPLSGSGFAVEWRYQFRGDGRLVLAYDGKTDRLADVQEEGATLDYEGLHQRGNASLILREAKVRHSGLYICTVYLPYLVAQVTMELQVVEPPSLSIHPSPLPLAVPGQSFTVQCEASGFAPPRPGAELGVQRHRWEVQASGVGQPNGTPAGLGREPTARAPGWSSTPPSWTWAEGGRSPVWPSISGDTAGQRDPQRHWVQLPVHRGLHGDGRCSAGALRSHQVCLLDRHQLRLR